GDEAGQVAIVYTVTLDKVNNTGSAITFDIVDAGTGTATSGSDYTAIPGGATISVADGSATGTYSVAVSDDALLESSETLDATISNASDAAINIAIASATATINDNDNAAGSIDADLSVSTDGDEAGQVAIVYTVTLDKVNNTGSAITFDIADAGTGTATSGSDYTAIPGGATISVADGSATGTYSVVVTDDTLFENDETLEATISNASDAAINIAAASATATISDSDNVAGSIDATLSVTTDGAEAGSAAIVYTVTLDKANNTGSAITFDIADAGTGTATSGSDYTAIPGG
ncbi:MAG: hypothetical protein GY938_13545, partial [Ketobacter sp.]|nr:hypothetical protein [Ketobacter sp.]